MKMARSQPQNCQNKRSFSVYVNPARFQFDQGGIMNDHYIQKGYRRNSNYSYVRQQHQQQSWPRATNNNITMGNIWSSVNQGMTGISDEFRSLDAVIAGNGSTGIHNRLGIQTVQTDETPTTFRRTVSAKRLVEATTCTNTLATLNSNQSQNKEPKNKNRDEPNPDEASTEAISTPSRPRTGGSSSSMKKKNNNGRSESRPTTAGRTSLEKRSDRYYSRRQSDSRDRESPRNHHRRRNYSKRSNKKSSRYYRHERRQSTPEDQSWSGAEEDFEDELCGSGSEQEDEDLRLSILRQKQKRLQRKLQSSKREPGEIIESDGDEDRNGSLDSDGNSPPSKKTKRDSILSSSSIENVNQSVNTNDHDIHNCDGSSAQSVSQESPSITVVLECGTIRRASIEDPVNQSSVTGKEQTEESTTINKEPTTPIPSSQENLDKSRNKILSLSQSPQFVANIAEEKIRETAVLRRTVERLQHIVKDHEKSIENFKLEIEQKEDKIKVIRGKKNEGDNNIMKLEKTVKDLETNNSQLKEEVKSKNEEIERLKRGADDCTYAPARNIDTSDQLIVALAYQDRLFTEVEKMRSIYEVEILKLHDYYEARVRMQATMYTNSQPQYIRYPPGGGPHLMQLPSNYSNNIGMGQQGNINVGQNAANVPNNIFGQGLNQRSMDQQQSQLPRMSGPNNVFAHLGAPDPLVPPMFNGAISSSATRVPYFLNAARRFTGEFSNPPLLSNTNEQQNNTGRTQSENINCQQNASAGSSTQPSAGN